MARPANVIWQLLFCCKAGHLLVVISSRPVPGGESAGCVRLQWLCSAGCVPARLCHAMHTALLNSLPPFSVAFPPVHSICARIVELQQFASCKTVLLAAATRACSGGPCAGF